MIKVIVLASIATAALIEEVSDAPDALVKEVFEGVAGDDLFDAAVLAAKSAALVNQGAGKPARRGRGRPPRASGRGEGRAWTGSAGGGPDGGEIMPLRPPRRSFPRDRPPRPAGPGRG